MKIHRIEIRKSDAIAVAIAVACAAWVVPKWANHVRVNDERAFAIAQCMDGDFSRSSYEACAVRVVE